MGILVDSLCFGNFRGDVALIIRECLTYFLHNIKETVSLRFETISFIRKKTLVKTSVFYKLCIFIFSHA